jgi:serine/threonine protein kinase
MGPRTRHRDSYGLRARGTHHPRRPAVELCLALTGRGTGTPRRRMPRWTCKIWYLGAEVAALRHSRATLKLLSQHFALSARTHVATPTPFTMAAGTPQDTLPALAGVHAALSGVDLLRRAAGGAVLGKGSFGTVERKADGRVVKTIRPARTSGKFESPHHFKTRAKREADIMDHLADTSTCIGALHAEVSASSARFTLLREGMCTLRELWCMAGGYEVGLPSANATAARTLLRDALAAPGAMRAFTLQLACAGAALFHTLRVKGVFHSDVSTNNLMLVRKPVPTPVHTWTIMAVDFGTAQRTEEPPRPVVGTLPYMPPDGSAVPSHARDLFAIGMTLFVTLAAMAPPRDAPPCPPDTHPEQHLRNRILLNPAAAAHALRSGGVHPVAVDFLLGAVQQDPATRLASVPAAAAAINAAARIVPAAPRTRGTRRPRDDGPAPPLRSVGAPKRRRRA